MTLTHDSLVSHARSIRSTAKVEVLSMNQYSFFHIVQELGHNIALCSSSPIVIGKLRLLSRKVKREIDSDELLNNVRLTVRLEGFIHALCRSREVRRFMQVTSLPDPNEKFEGLVQWLQSENLPPLTMNNIRAMCSKYHAEWYSSVLDRLVILPDPAIAIPRVAVGMNAVPYFVISGATKGPGVEACVGCLRYYPPALQSFYWPGLSAPSYTDRRSYVDYVRKNVVKKIKTVKLGELVDIHECSLQTFNEIVTKKTVVLGYTRYHQVVSHTLIAESMTRVKARIMWSREDVENVHSYLLALVERKFDSTSALLDGVENVASPFYRSDSAIGQAIHSTESLETIREYIDRFIAALLLLESRSAD